MERAAQTITTADGRTLCFAEAGDLDGRPVFSLHGTPGCRLMGARYVENGFEALLRSLGVRLITYDRPGYGRSDRNPGRRVVDCVQDVAAIAEAMGIDRFGIQGGSSGAHHALAVAARYPERVTRVACVAPMAPYDVLGQEEWSRGQDDGVGEYVGWCLEGEDRMVVEFAREDANLREAASPDDPQHAAVFEQTRNGIWGWVDDELSAFKPWAFDPAAVAVPTLIWYNLADPVLPRQHSEWLAGTVPGAKLVTTSALGHGGTGDPKPDWVRLYSWLIAAES